MIKILLTLACLSLPAWGDQNNVKVEGATTDIRWGKNWAGPELWAGSELKAPAELKGKVVLLKIWGG